MNQEKYESDKNNVQKKINTLFTLYTFDQIEAYNDSETCEFFFYLQSFLQN